MVRKIIAGIGRRTLPFPVVIDYQIPSQPHKPIRKIPDVGIVLLERPVNPYEYFLRQVFGRRVARRESVGQIVDSAGELTDDLRPSLLITAPTTLNQFSII
jgi:hypothetical protein